MLNVKNTDKHKTVNANYIRCDEEGRGNEGVREEFSLCSFEYIRYYSYDISMSFNFKNLKKTKKCVHVFFVKEYVSLF